jgi:hypothetical protein
MGYAKSKRGTIVLSLAAVASLGIAGALNASARDSQQIKSHALHFEPSKTLPGSPIKYSARAASYSLFLSDDEADVVLHGESTPSGEVTRGKLIVVHAYANLLRMRFVDSNLPTSIGPLRRENHSHSCTAVAYRGIYPGTDAVVRGDERRIGFQLNLGPGAADSDHIVLEIAGATSIQLNSAGDAIVYSGRESLTLQRPVVKIDVGANAKSIPGAYRIESGNRLRFIIEASTSENNQTITD